MSRIAPDWEWTDIFGDRLTASIAGEDLVLAIQRKHDPADYDHACISLSPEQQRGLRAALGVHMRGLAQLTPDTITETDLPTEGLYLTDDELEALEQERGYAAEITECCGGNSRHGKF